MSEGHILESLEDRYWYLWKTDIDIFGRQILELEDSISTQTDKTVYGVTSRPPPDVMMVVIVVIVAVVRFFTEQNNRLLQTLVDVSASQDRQLTGEHMKAMGLDPLTDRTFLMELVELHGIDVMLMVDNPCCPR